MCIGLIGVMVVVGVVLWVSVVMLVGLSRWL